VRSTHRFLTRLREAVERHAATKPDGEGGGTADGRDPADDHDPIDAYVAAEIDAAVAIAGAEYDDLTFNVALREAQDLVGTLRGYRDYADPHPTVYERGLDAAVRLLAPVAPHLAEELWERLGRDGFVVDADWPTAAVDRGTVERRRRLVEKTREDVRDIVDVAGIDDPERIDVVVAPEWKYDALEIAVESDADNLIGELMGKSHIREQGDAAAAYGKDLQANREALQRTLDGDEEYAALQSAGWLIEREFDAAVAVERADDAADDVARTAEPGRPAIDIVE
jgi:leucyl-tRNA synthetase